MAIEDEVIRAIREGRAKMRSRAYFVFRKITTGLALVILVCVLIYLVSFLFFAFRETGLAYAPSFGHTGWSVFFSSFPWILILLIAIFFVLLAILARRYPWSHRWPIIYSLFGVLFLVLTASVLIAQTSLYSAIFGLGDGGSPSAVNGLLSLPIPNDIYRGVVQTVMPDGFILEDRFGATSSVAIVSSTDLPTGPVAPHDRVIVLGDRNPSGTIAAVGVKKIAP